MPERIVWLSGMPRSGTNWLAQIFASHPGVRLKLCPLFSYEFKNALNEDSTPEEWAEFFPRVYATRSEYLDQDYLRRDGLVPAFAEKDEAPAVLAIKSTRFHNLTASILDKHPGVSFVGIVRHPCAAIHSWLTNPLEFPAGLDPRDQWRSGACRKTGPGEFWGFEDWKRVTELFLDLEARHPERFFLLGYEELVRDALGQTRGLFGRLGLGWPRQTEDFLRQSQSRNDAHKRSVFKSPAVATRWQGEMDPHMVRAIHEELRGTRLARFLDQEGA